MHTSHNTLEGEQYTAAMMVKSAADIETSAENVGERVTLLAQVATEISISLNDFKQVIKVSNDNSTKLSGKLFWLNVVLASATAVGAVATVILAFKK